MNVQEFYEHCKERNAENYRMFQLTSFPKDAPMAQHYEEKHLYKEEEWHMINVATPTMFFEYNDDYDKTWNEYIKRNSMTVQEYYNWAKKNNALNYEVECESTDSIRNGNYYLCDNCIDIDHDKKITWLLGDSC